MARITKSEQETSIVWDAEQKRARIYTADPVSIRKLDKLCDEFPTEYAHVWSDDDGTAKKYEVPARFIRFGKPSSRTMNDEQRQAARERLSKARRNLIENTVRN